MLRVARVARSPRSTCLASAVPLEDRHHVVRVLQKPPPETEGQGAKEGPKEPAEGAAEGAAARAEVSAGGDVGPAGEQVRVAGSLLFARHARMVPLCLWNPPWHVLRVLRVLRVTRVSILAFLWRTQPVFRVLQAPVRVKEEPPDSPERHAEPEGDPDTETAAEGKMTDGEIQEV